MPGFTPARRWQQAYYPFKNRSAGDKFNEAWERALKGALFGCRMCGNCLLQDTAFICPMECPKGLRNGPCGGSTPEHCYVDETRPCIWFKIYERAEKMGRLDKLMEIFPPLDWDKVGTSAMKDAWTHLSDLGGIKALWRGITSTPEIRVQKWDSFFKDVRQPQWWLGDDQPHPASPHTAVSHLETILTEGKFAITSEIAPPISSNIEEVTKKILMLKEHVDAVNFTDNPSATPRMSSLSCSLIALQNGVEPVMQVAARDRTRMGFQGEILGASAIGIRNILCLTGDHPRLGPPPHGRMDIWDLDAIQTVWLLRRMRDEGQFLDCRQIKCTPQVFIGSAGSPYASTPQIQARREEKKVNAGTQFMQTNLIYDLEGFEKYLEALQKRNVLERVFLLAGISPIRSVKAAYAMRQVPGVRIPDWIIKRMEGAADAREESVQITLELIEKVRRMPGVRGIHFMAVGWESIVPRLIQESGLR
ncbi:MAG: methylenetetrahydrofolate reductase C-terminal domain-containing protein [Chloroflexi bacterium]|nr:methylenetetrahydrofolate reductase C-terminal domain-containing protein [Chloroflexota bacterium]